MLNAITNLSRYSNHYSSSYDELALGAAIAIIIVAVFIFIAAILAQVFLGLAVYNDAKAKGNSNPGMWGVLTGIFGWIPAVIYLCTRNSAAQRIIQCTYCGFTIPANAPGCPNCNNANPFAQQFFGPEVKACKKRGKGFLIAAICMYAALILLVITIVVIVVAAVGTSYYY